MSTDDSPNQTSSLSIGVKSAYGFGSVAYGVNNVGFDYFLLLFYSQVIGLDARLVGVAIIVALVFDAISDPIVGYWSDNFRSRWGRRHPFMLAAAAPAALSYFLLWNPPQGWSQTGIFWYLLLLAVVIRTAMTFFETPSAALAPELTGDYDERSTLLSYRSYFGWTGGNAITVMMFFFLFPAMATESIADGRFNRDSYELLGIVASVLILLSIVVCVLGTRSRIKHLKQPPPQRRITVATVFREIFETLSNRSFLALFVAAMLGAVATGLAASLAFYFYTYFWEFTSIQTGLITMGVFVAAIIGFILAPVITRRVGKKTGAMAVGLVAFIGAPLPIALRLLGLLPENGTPFVFWFVFIAGIIDLGLIICFQILYASMMADLVEQSELRTGRRSEGVFFSSITFIRKSVQGFGLMMASLVLYWAKFPTGATVEQVSDEAIWRLGAYYVPTILIIWMLMMAVISAYRLNRAEHEENLRKLAVRQSTE
ncbi:MAG: MFS transporter [Gammaproteobacteria bacterium]|jgi:GPH family glycoside/pentoside/hexuronide:cation symporter|nr:MFS transporter [Gammaproteobacteria bacterium]